MERHIDTHPDDYPLQGSVVGKVTAVYPKDHLQNPVGTITLYQVQVHRQRPPATTALLSFVPAKGNLSGGVIEGEVPLVVGQWVVVAFLEGDPNRPYIDGKWFDQETTTLAETTSQHPREIHKINGNIATVDKNGNVEWKIAANMTLTVADSAGNVLLQLVKPGATYEVRLGDTAGIYRLIDERASSIFNNHTHVVAGIQPGTGSVTSAITTTTIGAGEMTSVTKAK